MGYPMTWNRVLQRNSLCGNYTHVRTSDGAIMESGLAPSLIGALRLLSGDLRRLERDATDPGSWRTEIAKRAGVTEEVVVQVLTAFWDGPLPPRHAHDGDENIIFFEGKYPSEHKSKQDP
jgi:hypothetical protein